MTRNYRILLLAAAMFTLNGCERLKSDYERNELGERFSYDEYRTLVTEYPGVESIDCGTSIGSQDGDIYNCFSTQFKKKKRAHAFFINPSVDPTVESSASVTTSTGRVFDLKYDSTRRPENGEVYLFIFECNEPAVSTTEVNERVTCKSVTDRTSDEFSNA